MSLWIEWEAEAGLDQQEKLNNILQKAVEAALQQEDITAPVEVSLTVVEEEQIKQMNAEFRSINRITDVLSFPLVSYPYVPDQEVPSNASAVLQELYETGEVDPETDEVMLGDIIICYQRAQDQAKEYGHSLEREMGFLAVHSVLHLLGYDHETKEQETIMFAKQETVLESIGLYKN